VDSVENPGVSHGVLHRRRRVHRWLRDGHLRGAGKGFSTLPRPLLL
jgi:hypothetical protein